MYDIIDDIFTYIWRIVMLNMGKYNIPNIESIVIISFNFPAPSKAGANQKPYGMVN